MKKMRGMKAPNKSFESRALRRGAQLVVVWKKMTTTMPKYDDVFEGKINDLCNYDSSSWRRRDITFIKREIKNGVKYAYPTLRKQIVLIDSDGVRYKLNITKPETDQAVCIGTPSRLKSWYLKKGFEHSSINANNKIFFMYTGHGVEFLILTMGEYLSKIGDTVK